jgi:hypothetical protein
MTMPRLPPQGFPGPQIQVAYYSENLATLGAGAKGYTGIGFKPRTLEILARIASTTQVGSHGFSDQDGHAYMLTIFEASLNSGISSDIVFAFGAAGWYTAAVLTSYDADGFTLTWRLVGAGHTGTLNMMVRAMS